MPEDFFDDETPGGTYFEPNEKYKSKSSLKDNFIFESLNTFYELCMAEPIEGRKVSKKIKSRVIKIKELMQNRFNIDISTENERLNILIAKSKDISALAEIQTFDGRLAEREQHVNSLMENEDEEQDRQNSAEENTYDNEETQGQNRITKKDIEIFRKQLAAEDDEYLPCIVDVHEKLINFD